MIAPTIETERLRLVMPSMEHLDGLTAFYAQERTKFVGGPMEASDVWRLLLRAAGHWHLRGYGMWQIVTKDTGDYVGAVGIIHHIEWPEPELAWNIAEKFEGQSMMFEAALTARRSLAQHCGLNGLASFIEKDNTRSIKLAERMGATYEGDKRVMTHDAQIWRHPQEDV